MRLFFKYIFALGFSFFWVLVSIYLSYPWVCEIAKYIGFFLAWTVVMGISLIPGIALSFVGISLYLDSRPRFKIDKKELPPISILIAAYNEESTIYSTLQSIYSQKYPSEFEVIVVSDGSTDRTIDHIKSFEKNNGCKNIIIVDNQINKGKALALNQGLDYCKNELIVCVDADSTLHELALEKIIYTMIGSDENYAAVAGTILCKNYQKSFMARLQYWDYLIGISSIKRIQSMYQGTLVAQGAFSVYKKSILVQIGGWPDKIGEDIVLTWDILNRGYKVGHAEHAICFTNVPETYRGFYNQRKRWSRGLIEAFFSYPKLLFKNRKSTFFVWYNLFFPFIDSIFLFVFFPGVMMAIFYKFYLIAGIVTLLQIPLAVLYNITIYLIQKQSLNEEKISLPNGMWLTSVVYILIYQLIMIPATLDGYLSELLNKKKTWGDE